MDIRAAQAAVAYANARPAAPANPAPDGPMDALAKVTETFADQLKHTDATAGAAMTGGADPHALVQALAETQLAVEAAVTVRDRVVEAYQEILRMPV